MDRYYKAKPTVRNAFNLQVNPLNVASFAHTCMWTQHAIEHRSVFSLVQVDGPHCDNRGPAGLVLKHTGVKHALSEEWPVVIHIKDRHEHLTPTKRQRKYEQVDKLIDFNQHS